MGRSQRGVAGGEHEPFDPVLDRLRVQELHRPQIARSGDVGPPTRLHVRADLDDPDRLARWDPTLVEVEPVLRLGVVAVGPRLCDGDVLPDQFVRHPFDRLDVRPGDPVVVGHVQPCGVDPLLGAGLADVVTEHLPGGVADDVGRRVVSHQPSPPVGVELAADELTLPRVPVRPVEHDPVVDLYVGHLDGRLLRRECPVVGGLPTTLRVEHRLVQHHVTPVLAVEHVEHDCLELRPLLVVVVEPVGLRQVRQPVVRLGRGRRLRPAVVAGGDQPVEVVGHVHRRPLLVGDLRDRVRLDPVGVVQLDQFVRRHRLVGVGVLLGELADPPAPAVERLAVLAHLRPHHVPDQVAVLVPQPLGLHVDQLVEGGVDPDPVDEPFGAAQHHPREVARPDVRRDDLVAEHVRQRPTVVRDRVDVLQRLQ